MFGNLCCHFTSIAALYVIRLSCTLAACKIIIATKSNDFFNLSQCHRPKTMINTQSSQSQPQNQNPSTLSLLSILRQKSNIKLMALAVRCNFMSRL
mmetsp:Transcript_13944/g.33817  ORF Transcript_13944/g.33817 Transcript_13944/m.33817 type:complete len:96 (-) Transcript_13944:2161-2448(-)